MQWEVGHTIHQNTTFDYNEFRLVPNLDHKLLTKEELESLVITDVSRISQESTDVQLNLDEASPRLANEIIPFTENCGDNSPKMRELDMGPMSVPRNARQLCDKIGKVLHKQHHNQELNFCL